MKSFQGLSRDRDVSIERAYKQLLANSKISLDEESPEKQQVLRAIFAVLCWTSATLKPIFDDETIATAIMNRNGRSASGPSVAAKNSSEIEFYTGLGQPLRTIFKNLRGRTVKADYSESTRSDDVLYQSSLDYFSLLTIGRVKLKWVDTLTSHLAFDRSKRTLYIFRFPSYCAINVLFGGSIESFKECVFIPYALFSDDNKYILCAGK